MDRIRYFLGVLHVIVVPAGLLFWLIIHPWASFWRRWGPRRTYSIVLPLLAFVGAGLFRFRERLLGPDFGTNYLLVALAILLFFVIIPLDRQYRKHLRFATLVGLPELSTADQDKGRVLREGIYGVVRHPRYLSAGLGLLANTCFINYGGMYLLILLSVPVGFGMVLLEERELVNRFGEEYRQYQREVPRLIPRRWIQRK